MKQEQIEKERNKTTSSGKERKATPKTQQQALKEYEEKHDLGSRSYQ